MFSKSVTIGLFAALAALGRTAAEDAGFKLEPLHVMANWEVGEVEKFVPDPAAAVVPGDKKQLMDHSGVWLLQEARLAENAKVFVGVGGMYFFILPSQGNQYSFGQRSAFGLTDAHGEFTFLRQGENDHGLLVKAGVFPFKYNEDAKNLGEYMFRTYTYPTIINTGGLVVVNSAGAQLNGVDANTKIGGISNDLMVTVKTDQIPSAALSLTDLVSYTFKSLLTVGAGYMFDNFYDATGLAKGDYDAHGAGSLGDYFVLKDGTVAYRNGSGTAPDDSLIASRGHYTFQGQKAMVRASLDIARIFNNPLISGKDLTVYFEGVIMGMKNYPGYYNKLSDRMAFMAGLNLPTLHLLDLLSVEGEYCSNPYANNAASATLNLVPTPSDDGLKYHGDDVKWTIYARKNVLRSFSITAQVANDHLRLVDYFGHTNDKDIFQNRNNWYWALQMGYSI